MSLGNLFTSFTYSTFVTINNETLPCNEINRFAMISFMNDFYLKDNLNFLLTMPFASPFGKYGDGKYVGIPRAE